MSSNKFIVAPPRIVEREIVKPLLCGPGPCDYYPSIAEALSKPVLTPICDEFFNVLDDIRAGLQYVFQTRSKLVLAMSGSGHTGMEAVISNLVGPGETLLIASRGIWDQRAFMIANRYGIKTEVVSIPMDTTFNPQQLEPELKRLRPAGLFVTHGDSSTGTLQNLQGLGDLCHKYGTLLLVDTVVSLGGVPFFMDEWGIDGVYTSTQKVFSGPAGISPVAFSARAEAKIKSRKHDPPFYFDIKLLAQQWNCYGSTRTYHHTLSPPLFWALRCCLQEIIKETLAASWARHAATTARFHKRLREYSFEFLIPNPEDRLATVTTVKLPKGYDYVEFVKYMRAKYGTLLLVDTVVSLGGVPFFMDEWGIDGVYTSTQKVFSGPAGISPVAFSARAEAKIKSRKHDPPFYFDIKLLAQQWNCYGSTRTYHHTLSPPLYWALRCCLQEIIKETLAASWARHAATTARFHKRLREYSFEFLIPNPEDRLATVTTVKLPKGYDYVEFVKYMRAKHNILIFAGLGPTVGKALRIGIMGVNSTIQVADSVAEAMADTLRALKKSSL